MYEIYIYTVTKKLFIYKGGNFVFLSLLEFLQMCEMVVEKLLSILVTLQKFHLHQIAMDFHHHIITC